MSKASNLVTVKSVFHISRGNKLDLNKMSLAEPSDESVLFIGRSGENNGIVAIVQPLDGVEPYPAGCITVALGGAALSSFVQPRPFYTAQNIDVLTPKKSLSFEQKLYYCKCIEANRFRYSTYGREANRTLSALLIPSPLAIPAWVGGVVGDAVEKAATDLRSIAAKV